MTKLEEGLKIKEWTYMEDLALSMPETASEYRELLLKKGKDEIDKRKFFLLSTGSINATSAPPPTKVEKTEKTETKMEIC